MLDTNVYDLVVAQPGFTERLNRAVEAGHVDIVRTRVQENEIARIQSAARRSAMRRIRGRTVPTVSPPPGPWPSDDALIALTAEVSADALVTEDKELRERVQAASNRLDAWSFAQLVEFVDALPE
jgi:predicted nucleic acid-binding protein